MSESVRPLVIETEYSTTTFYPPDVDGEVEICKEPKSARYGEPDVFIFVKADALMAWLTSALTPEGEGK